MRYLRQSLARLLVLPAFLGVGSCASPPEGGEVIRAPRWPYAGVTSTTRTPVELRGRIRFGGGWIESTPNGEHVLTESGNPRFVVRIPFYEEANFSFLDLGMGASVEAVGFLDEGRSAVFVSAVSSPHHGNAVYARALLVVDMDQGLLLDSFPISRDGASRGLDLDPYDHRAFLLSDRGTSAGMVESIDLFGGRRLARASIGVIPARVSRKGLALGRDGRVLFCLAGGEGARSDFEPIDAEAPSGPELLMLDTDSLRVTGRVPLDERFEPRVVVYDEDRDRAYVLQTRNRQSRILIVDAAFGDERTWVDLPEETTDLILSGGFGFAPGANGIYIVDLDLESWVSRPSLPFEFTGEMAVSGDRSTAFVLFQTARVVGGPGIASVALQTGNLIEVLQ